ncbi:MAG: hypothetical protein M3P15_00450, partial [Actinomycetota bacterium]|nr:hypothetical protein [Actinomycetota bacterium]
RTTLELSALASGWALGGTVGIGTIVYALAIVKKTHYFIPLLRIDERPDWTSKRASPRGVARARIRESE